MKVTFLGTGTSQGVPVIGCHCDVCKSQDKRDDRLRSSVHISLEDTSIVIDTGPDFRMQMLREGIERLDAILYTHQHKDHVAGLDDVRSFNFLQQMDMPVYANAMTIEQLKNEFPYAFSKDRYPGAPKIITTEIGDSPFYIKGIKVIPIPLMHRKLPVLGFRIGDFTYITDANYISEASTELIRGSSVIVINALRKKKHISHFNLQEAINEIHRLQPERAYITHISHKMGLHREVSKELPEGILLAYDGLKIDT